MKKHACKAANTPSQGTQSRRGFGTLLLLHDSCVYARAHTLTINPLSQDSGSAVPCECMQWSGRLPMAASLTAHVYVCSPCVTQLGMKARARRFCHVGRFPWAWEWTHVCQRLLSLPGVSRSYSGTVHEEALFRGLAVLQGLRHVLRGSRDCETFNLHPSTHNNAMHVHD